MKTHLIIIRYFFEWGEVIHLITNCFSLSCMIWCPLSTVFILSEVLHLFLYAYLIPFEVKRFISFCMFAFSHMKWSASSFSACLPCPIWSEVLHPILHVCPVPYEVKCFVSFYDFSLIYIKQTTLHYLSNKAIKSILECPSISI